jgi:hypothetical protein
MWCGPMQCTQALGPRAQLALLHCAGKQNSLYMLLERQVPFASIQTFLHIAGAAQSKQGLLSLASIAASFYPPCVPIVLVA